MLKTLLAPTAALTLLVAMPQAEAANLQPTKQLVRQGIQHLNQAYGYREMQEMRMAERKFSRAKNDLFYVEHSPLKRRAINSLDDAIDALNDRWLPKHRQIFVAKEEAQQALRLIQRLDDRHGSSNKEELDEVIEIGRRAMQAIRNDNERRAQRLLDHAIDGLQPFRYDRQIVSAIQHVRELKQLLRNDYINDHRKQMRARQLAREIKQLITTSRAYHEVDRGRPGRAERLGTTGHFTRRGFTTETLWLGMNRGNGIDRVVLVAQESDLDVQSVAITFGNGRTRYFNGQFVREGGRMVIELPGRMERNVSKIAVTARSMDGYRRGQGYFVINGR